MITTLAWIGAGIGQIPLLREFGQRVSGMRPQKASRRRGKCHPSLGYLASYARIAIHISEFSSEVGKMAQRTRNKIA
jgi:hypothetical protein